MEEPGSDELSVAQHPAADGDEDLVDEDSMPGYHEEEHEHEFEAWPVEPHGQDTSAFTKAECAAPRARPPRPPNSAPGPSSQPLDVDGSSRSTKPHSTIASFGPRSDAPTRTRVSVVDWQNSLAATSSSTDAHGVHLTEDQDDATNMLCPICGDEKFADNTALNAHIDWCLSRGAIRAAQGEARAGDGTSSDEDADIDQKGATSAKVETMRKNGKSDAERTSGAGSEHQEWWKIGVPTKTTKTTKVKGKPGKAKG